MNFQHMLQPEGRSYKLFCPQTKEEEDRLFTKMRVGKLLAQAEKEAAMRILEQGQEENMAYCASRVFHVGDDPASGALIVAVIGTRIHGDKWSSEWKCAAFCPTEDSLKELEADLLAEIKKSP